MAENKELLDYITESKKEGLPDSEIQNRLEESGWDGVYVSKTLKLLNENERKKHSLSFFQKKVPAWMAVFVIFFFSASAFFVSFLYIGEEIQIINLEITLKNEKGERLDFSYGSWPAMENADFFEKKRQSFQAEEMDFIEADLSAMKMRVYRSGEKIEELPIISKGRPGSWWETPAGIYKIESKIKNHFSSFAEVYLPWSLPFQGNFFIHGWPYYRNGEPVSAGYSGGCIRLSDEDAEKVFNLSKTGMPVLVFEDSFAVDLDEPDKKEYVFRGPPIDAESYFIADLNNNFVFAEKKPDQKRSISSIAKLMTAVVSVEHINVERQISITPSMLVETEVPRLRTGESLAVLDLLSLVLMESSNEAVGAVTSVLGENGFVGLMNEKAGAIGMTETEFVDVFGASPENISTLHDLFMFAKHLYHNRSFILHMSIGEENRAAYGSPVFRDLKNFNKLAEEPGMVGGKINFSDSAPKDILAVFEIEISGTKRPVAVIIIGSAGDVRDDAVAVIEYIKKNFEF